MKWLTTVMINKRIAKRWGTRAAAVFGWLFAQCQAQVPREECKRTACGRGVYRKVVRVRVSCCELGKLLHLSRHTVEAILKRLEADGIIDVWLPRGEDRTRSYSIAPRGFTLLHRWAGEWHTNDEECSLAWGLDTRVASRVGVNAAIVFQYLWSWSTGWSWGGHYTKGGRTWLPYTAAELSRWLPFLSDDVIEDALHTLQAEGLLVKMRQGKLTKWAINDAGYLAMGEVPFVQCGGRNHLKVAKTEVSSPHTPHLLGHALNTLLQTYSFSGKEPQGATQEGRHTQADEEAWAMAVARIKAVRKTARHRPAGALHQRARRH